MDFKNKFSSIFKFLSKNINSVKVSILIAIIACLLIICFQMRSQVDDLKNLTQTLENQIDDKKQQSLIQKEELLNLRDKSYELINDYCSTDACLFEKDGLTEGMIELEGYRKENFQTVYGPEYSFEEQISQGYVFFVISNNLFSQNYFELQSQFQSINMSRFNDEKLSQSEIQLLNNSTETNPVKIRVLKTVRREPSGPFTNGATYHLLSVK